MIFAHVVPVLALAASALGLTVTSPANSSDWTTNNTHTVTWSSVSTDVTNFTILLVNENMYPPYNQQLNALVQTSVGSIDTNAPSTGWPTGQGYQINLVASTTSLSEILAQSQEFTITPGASSNSSSTSSSTPSSTSSSSSPSGSPPTTPPSSQSPSKANGAAASLGVQGFFYSLVGLLGIVLV